MKAAVSLLAIAASLSLAACGSGDTQTYEYPSESMEPAIAYKQKVTVDLSAYEAAAPARGDVVAYHPPRGADAAGGECGVEHPAAQPCPRGTTGLSSATFIKRIVALPGERLSIRDGLPVVDGKPVLAGVIQQCRVEACELPRPITIPAGEYFVMGDNSAASFDSRFSGPVPRAAILGQAEL